MPELSMQEVFGQAEPAAEVKPQGQELSHEAIFNTPPAFEQEAKAGPSVLGAVGEAAGQLGKATAAAVDMIAGIPAQLLGVGAAAGARAAALGSGESRQIQDLASAAAQEQIPQDVAKMLGIHPELLTKPTQYLIERFGGGKEFDQSVVTKTVDSIAKTLEHSTGGVVTEQDAKDYFNTVMAAGGVKGVEIGGKALGEHIKARAAERATAERPAAPVAESGVPLENPDPARYKPVYTEGKLTGWEDKSKPPTAEEAGAVSAKQVKEIFARAKKGVTAEEADVQTVKNIFERALRPQEAAAPEAAAEEPAVTPKTRIATPPMIGEEIPQPISDALDSAFGKISRGERPTLTAEELLALRAMRQSSPIVDAMGKPMRGAIDPRLLKVMGAFAGGVGVGLTGLGLYKMYETWQDYKKVKEQNEQLEMENKSLRQLQEDMLRRRDEEQNKDQELTPRRGKILAEAAGITALMAPALIGAMRVKGTGIWSPRAVEGLHGELAASLHGPEETVIQGLQERGKLSVDATDAEMWKAHDAHVDALRNRSEKMVTDYLNRHAGTETDPLRDIKIPVGDKMVRWEDVTDKAFEAARIPERLDLMKQGKAEIGEPIWSLGKDRGYITDAEQASASSSDALKSYLSHVGDYLRLNVDPAKLGQYDLVRAVKETAANDERVAKLAEKARVASSKELPTVKEYSDGSRWVEIKAPEKLTAEQGKRVKQVEYAGIKATGSRGGSVYEALDTQGKPIENNYTREPARGATPEEAFLAGRLAEEGNIMGHCVGGYCADVFAGNSRIFSLRDAKGESHVTVEVTKPGDVLSGEILMQKGPQGKAAWEDYLKELEVNRNEDLHNFISRRYPQLAAAIENTPDNIAQIKGKQNRAPDSRYLPAVQDFVKAQGPWGEVGDLEGTGLTKGSNVFKWPDFKRYAEQAGIKFDPESYYTDAEVKSLISQTAEVKAKSGLDSQRGSADPKHLAKLAVLAGGVALGAYLDPQHPVQGGLFGSGVATLLLNAHPKAWAEAVRRAQVKGPIARIDDLTSQTAYQIKVGQRAAYQLTSEVDRLVPDAVRREAIYDFLENERPTNLSAAERQVAGKVRAYLDTLGRIAKDAGVVKQMIGDYATRIYGKDKGLFESSPVGGAATSSPFGKPRGYQTRAEAEAAGYTPITTDISQVITAYSDSITKAINNAKLVDSLRASELADGTKLVVKEGKGAPRDYQRIDAPQLRGLVVHPDIASDLKFVFDAKDPGAIIHGLDVINSAQKRLGVSMSLFHAAALEHALLGGMRIAKSPIVGAKAFGQSFMPAVFGESLAVKQIREGGLGDVVDRGMKAGLQFGFERATPTIAEERLGIYGAIDGVTKYLDNTVPGLGKYTTGVLAETNRMFDRAMWGRFHATMKLATFEDKVSELSRNNARANTGKSAAEIGKMAASFTNDLFGGLDWQKIAGEFESRWGREMANAALSPTGRLGMRLLMFAPDWTISTTRAFLKSFGKLGVATAAGAVMGVEASPEHKLIAGVLGGLAGYGAGRAGGLKSVEGTGIKGLLRPTELADLHRQYFMRSAFIYTTIVDTLNYQMSGHHIWDNKDPTRLDRGDGTTQQVSKHFMEPMHWITTPGQQALNKLSFIVKEPANQILSTEYLSTHGAPRMGLTPPGEPITLGTRIGHAARQFTPITAQGFEAANPQKAGWSAIGMPVYGKTYEERAALKEERKRAAIQRRIEKRAKEQR